MTDHAGRRPGRSIDFFDPAVLPPLLAAEEVRARQLQMCEVFLATDPSAEDMLAFVEGFYGRVLSDLFGPKPPP